MYLYQGRGTRRQGVRVATAILEISIAFPNLTSSHMSDGYITGVHDLISIACYG